MFRAPNRVIVKGNARSDLEKKKSMFLRSVLDFYYLFFCYERVEGVCKAN